MIQSPLSTLASWELAISSSYEPLGMFYTGTITYFCAYCCKGNLLELISRSSSYLSTNISFIPNISLYTTEHVNAFFFEAIRISPVVFNGHWPKPDFDFQRTQQAKWFDLFVFWEPFCDDVWGNQATGPLTPRTAVCLWDLHEWCLLT